MDYDFAAGMGAIAACVISLIVSITVYNVNEAEAKRVMVERGATPLEARCAFAGASDAICLTLANSKTAR